MPANTSVASTHKVPCALQHYLNPTNAEAPNHALSQVECQMAFQNWAAYVRGGDCDHSLDVTAKEALTCPLLWCRESFDSLAPTLQHVSKCLWLPNTWYWCPYCGRPESFVASQEPFANHLQRKIRGKDSKLKRAVTFFKHLGFKSCSRHKSSGSSSAYTGESFDTWLAKQQTWEMEDTRSKLPELAGNTVCAVEATAQRYELESRSQPQSNGTVANAANLLSDIGAQFGVARKDVRLREEMVVSPISTIQGPFDYQIAELDTSLHADHGSISPIYRDSKAAPSPKAADQNRYPANITLTHSGLLLSSVSDGSLCDGAMLSTESRVEELREMIRVLNEEWTKRYQSSPEILQCALAMSPPSLFDTGVQTLQLVFRGVLPETLDAVFALAHLACAAAYIMHSDDSSHCWDNFFHDILALQTLILNKRDARTFVHLVNLLWWPQGTSARRCCGSHDPDETNSTLTPLPGPIPDLDETLSPETNDLQSPRRPRKSAAMSILGLLKRGAIFQECSSFLDGVEYANILERNKKYPTDLAWYAQNHVANIEELAKTIICPLQKCNSIEALHDCINITAMELGNGSLRSTREVEVSLISNGRSSCLSSQVLDRYADRIASKCDCVMHKAGPNWRDRYYATDLDTVLASAVEMNNRQRLNGMQICRPHLVQVMAMPDTHQTRFDNIPTPSSVTSQTFTGSSPSTVASTAHINDSSPQNHPSLTASPESSFSAPSPSFFDADVTRCTLCPAVFKGSAGDRASNLRRHMRTTREHSNTVGFTCRRPGCGTIMSRSDNLKKHVKAVHQGDAGTSLGQQRARKRKGIEELE